MPHSSNSHRKYNLKFHLILVFKYGKKLFQREGVGEFMKSEMLRISEDSDFKIETLEVDKDHIHLLVDVHPNVSILQIVRKLKQESTIAVWRQFAEMLSKQFWKERTFWTNGYFASTIGDASEETVRRYIESQG